MDGFLLNRGGTYTGETGFARDGIGLFPPSLPGPAAAVLVIRRPFPDPGDEAGEIRLILQRFKAGKIAGKLGLAQDGMDRLMADAMQSDSDFPAMAAGQQVMLINAGARDQGPAAKRAKLG